MVGPGLHGRTIVYDDHVLRSYLLGVFNRVRDNADHPDTFNDIVVLHDTTGAELRYSSTNTVMTLSTRLLERCNSEDELAALIAEHFVRAGLVEQVEQNRNLSRGVWEAVRSGDAELFQARRDRAVQFNREIEQQRGEEIARLIFDAGYNPHAAETSCGLAGRYYRSSQHNNDRRHAIAEEILEGESGSDLLSSQYQNAIDGLPYSWDPLEYVIRQQTYIDRFSDFAVAIPPNASYGRMAHSSSPFSNVPWPEGAADIYRLLSYHPPRNHEDQNNQNQFRWNLEINPPDGQLSLAELFQLSNSTGSLTIPESEITVAEPSQEAIVNDVAIEFAVIHQVIEGVGGANQLYDCLVVRYDFEPANYPRLWLCDVSTSLEFSVPDDWLPYVAAFRPQTEEDRQSLRQRHIGLYEVQPDDTIASIAAHMAYGYEHSAESELNRINQFFGFEVLEPGRIIKVVSQ